MDMDTLKSTHHKLEKSACDYKIEVATLKGQLEDSDFTKQKLQRQLQHAQSSFNTGQRTPSIRGNY